VSENHSKNGQLLRSLQLELKNGIRNKLEKRTFQSIVPQSIEWYQTEKLKKNYWSSKKLKKQLQLLIDMLEVC